MHPRGKPYSGPLSFERLPGEPSLAWGAFVAYREMGPKRTMEAVRINSGRAPGGLRTLQTWSTRWHWQERCRIWDNYVDAKIREASLNRIPMWEQRRAQSLEQNLLAAAQLRDRLQEMINHPLTRTVEKEYNGKTVTIIEPAKWNWTAVIAGYKMVSELEAATIAEGLLEADDEDFDVETADEEQLKTFIRKHRRQRSGPPPSPGLSS